MVTMDAEMMAEQLRARLIVAGVAFRMLDGAWLRSYWTRKGCFPTIRARAWRLLQLAEAEDA